MKQHVDKRVKDARDAYAGVAGDLDALLADVDGALITTLVEPWLAETMDGAIYEDECSDDADDDYDDGCWVHSGMRWAPPPGPGEEDPYADPEETERFLARVRDDTPRPEPRSGWWSIDPVRQNPVYGALLEGLRVELDTRILWGNGSSVTRGGVLFGGDTNRPVTIQQGTLRAGDRVRASAGTHDGPGVLDVSARNAVAVRLIMDRMRAPTITPPDTSGLTRAAERIGERLRQMMAPLLALGRAIEQALPSEPPSDQRDRALYLHQARTYPSDHEPFRHRGGITRERVPEQRRRGFLHRSTRHRR